MTSSLMVLPGIYVITPDGLDAGDIERGAARLLGAGAVLMQLRSAHLAPRQREALGLRLGRLCAKHSVPLIVNDDVQLAARIGADGVHLGRDDASIDDAREQLGAKAWIGVSCYDDPLRARQLAAAGATYVAFGAVYPTASKATPHRAGLELFAQWDRADVPTVAIGGLCADNAEPVIRAGARWLAMIGALWSAPDPAAELRRAAALFPSNPEHLRA